MKKLTILIPNYKTPKLTKLCLRLLRKNTDLNAIDIIAIDNHSNDASLEYLKSLDWIKLIERKPEDDDTPPLSHARALDLGLSYVNTPYVLVIHTDTMFKNKQWLSFLLSYIENKPNIAGVGSWKLECKPLIRRLLKKLENHMQLAWYKMIGKKNHAIQGVGKNYYYLRSHCALYRTDLLKQHHLSFAQDQDTAGKSLHKGLIDNGFEMIFLPSELLGQYIEHINHATMVLNPELGARKKTITQGQHKIKSALKRLKTDMILADDALDQH